MKHEHLYYASNQQGVALLEVLVAVVILAVGLLGMAGLQARALQQNHSSVQRSQAVILSYSILDSLRADRANAVAGAYNMANTCAAPAPTGAIVGDTISNWLTAIQNRFGNNGASCGFVNCDITGQCTVRIIWDDSRAGGSQVETFEIRSKI